MDWSREKCMFFLYKKNNNIIFFMQILDGHCNVAFGGNFCDHKIIKEVHCQVPTRYNVMYLWTRHPLRTTRMWNLLSIFDPPAYTCFFSSLLMTVVLLKLYTFLGRKLGLLESSYSELVLIPLG